jgi:hypothetical protein
MRTALSRLERAGVQRRAARDCPPHPPARQVWQPGDWATPDTLVCSQCWATLARRPHDVARPAGGDA